MIALRTWAPPKAPGLIFGILRYVIYVTLGLWQAEFHCWCYSVSFLFSFDRNDSVLYVRPLYRVQVVCPNPSTVMKQGEVDSTEKEYQNLWIVSRESYERCSTDKSQGSKLLLRCDTPLSLQYLTLLFQKYSAVYDFGYNPGQEYYFIGMLI